MPKLISIPHLPDLLEGVYLPYTALQNGKRGQTLLEETRAWVKRKQAQQEEEAHALEQQAVCQGYQTGLLLAAQGLAEYFADQQRLLRTMQTQLEQDARNLLSAAISDAQVILSLVDEWSANRKPEQSLTLQITLPKKTGLTRAQILERLEASWQERTQVIYHDLDDFRLQYGDEFAEFNPEAFTQKIQLSLSRKLNNVLPQACIAVQRSCLEKILACFSDFLGRLPVAEEDIK